MAVTAANVNVETQIPGIPAVTGLPENLRALLAPMKEILDLRNGVNGDPLDKALTRRDLYEAGLLRLFIRGTAYTNTPTETAPYSGTVDPGELDFTPPAAITGLTVTAALSNMIIVWDEPADTNYAYTEIWRSATNDIGTAIKAATSVASLYADPIGVTAATRYYWVRTMSTASVAGPFNAVGGTSDTTGAVQTADLAALSVTSAKIGLLAVDSAQIASAAIVEAKIANLAVTAAKIANATITTAKIANAQITTALIADANITTAKIANANITTALIADANITNAKIGTAAVDTLQLAGQAVTIPTSAYSATSVTLGSGGPWATLGSITWTSTGNPTTVIFSGLLYFGTADPGACTIRMKHAGSVIWTGDTEIYFNASNSIPYHIGLVITPAAGSVTVLVEGSAASSTGAAMSNNSLLAIETKR